MGAINEKANFQLDEDRLIIRQPGDLKDLDRVQTVETSNPVGDIFEKTDKQKAPVYFMDDDFYHQVHLPEQVNETVADLGEP